MNTGKTEPLASIILPTYNSADGLADTVSSILHQTLTDLELIIIDDGSTDNTRSVLAGFTDPRITVIRHPENFGVARAYNTGLDVARGTYIGFIGSGDEWIPEKLAEEVSAFRCLSPEFGVVYSDLWEITPAGKRRYWQNPEILGPELINSDGTDYQVNYLGNGAILVRRVFFDQAGPFDEQFRCFTDTDMIIRLQRICRFHHIQKPLYIYHSNRGLSSNPIEVSHSRILLLQKYPETLQNQAFLMHQIDMIRHSLRKAGVDERQHRTDYTTYQNGSISENFFRIIDNTVIRYICPAGSRRKLLFIRGLTACRKHVNPLLRPQRK